MKLFLAGVRTLSFFSLDNGPMFWFAYRVDLKSSFRLADFFLCLIPVESALPIVLLCYLKDFSRAVRSIKRYYLFDAQRSMWMENFWFRPEFGLPYCNHSTCQINLFNFISFPFINYPIASNSFSKKKCMTCLLNFKNGLYFSPLFLRTNFGIQLLVYFLSYVFLFIASCSTCCPPKRLTCHCSVFLAFLSSTLLTYSSKTNSMFTLFHQILCSPWFSVFPCLGSHFCQGSINPPALFKCYRLREAQLLNVFTLIFIVFLIHY